MVTAACSHGCFAASNAVVGNNNMSPLQHANRYVFMTCNTVFTPGDLKRAAELWAMTLGAFNIFAPELLTFMRRAILFIGANTHSARLSPATNLKSRCVSCIGFALRLLRLLAFSQDWVLGFKEDFLTRATGVKIRLLGVTPGKCAFPADRAASPLDLSVC